MWTIDKAMAMYVDVKSAYTRWQAGLTPWLNLFLAGFAMVVPFLIIDHFKFSQSGFLRPIAGTAPKGDFKDALAYVMSASQWLSTISVSIAAATGYLYMKCAKGRPAMAFVLSLTAIGFAILSAYQGVSVAQFAAFDTYHDKSNIDFLSAAMSEQGKYTLISVCALCGLVTGARE